MERSELDKIVLISFGFVVATVGTVAAIHLAVRAERIDRARAFQRWARWIYPLLYLAAFIPVLLAALDAQYRLLSATTGLGGLPRASRGGRRSHPRV